MTREARRREQRAERKGRLDSDTVGRFNEARRLPPDHPSATSASPLLTSPEQAHRYLDLIRRSGVGAAIEARLGDHPGRRSRLRAEALLLAALLAASERQSYRRTDLCAVLNGLDARVAFRVGLCDRGTRTPISYSITHKQVQRIESALADGWIAPDGQEWDLHWFSQWILRATIPREVATRITAVAVDSTFVESWAPSKDYSREADPLAAHRLASRDTPDLPEPELAAPARAATGIGSIGADGRRQRSADPDARPGWRSATAKRPAGVALGYDLHLACAARDSNWGGHPGRLKLGEPMPAYIAALKLTPGSTDPGPIGRRVVDDALSLAPNIREVIADRGYTAKRRSFVRPLHEQGLDIVMDYTNTEIARPKAMTVRGGTQPVIMHCGTILPPWLPDTLHAPPPTMSSTERSSFYDSRSQWRWASHQNLGGGKRQMLCPQCAGRVTTNAATRKPRKAQPSPSAPHLHITNLDTCCNGPTVFDVEHLDAYQKIPYGTTAWQYSYGRRNQIENVNSQCKDKGGLKPGWIRAFGLTRHTIAATILAAVYNLALTPKNRHDTPTTPAGPDQPPEPPGVADTPQGPTNLRAPP